MPACITFSTHGYRCFGFLLIDGNEVLTGREAHRPLKNDPMTVVSELEREVINPNHVLGYFPNEVTAFHAMETAQRLEQQLRPMWQLAIEHAQTVEHAMNMQVQAQARLGSVDPAMFEPGDFKPEKPGYKQAGVTVSDLRRSDEAE